MAKPIRWTRRTFKLASGLSRLVGYYGHQSLPLVNAYRDLDMKYGFNPGYWPPTLYARLSDFKRKKAAQQRKAMGDPYWEDELDIPF